MAEESAAVAVLAFSVFEVDLRTGELRKQGIRIRLQDQPFQILKMLLERPGELVTREEIKERLWPSDTFVDFDHSVNAAMRRLREALSDSAETPRYVETLPRRGYRFIAKVEASPRVQSTITEPSDPVVTKSTEISTGSLPHPSFLLKLGRSQRTWAILGLLALLIGATALTWYSWPRNEINSIAVVPLINESKDETLDYLAFGLPGGVIDSLSEVSGLRVASRNSSFTQKFRTASAHDIATALKVRAVALGSIRKEAGMLHVTVELVDTTDDRHLWGGDYKVNESDLTVLENTIAAEITQKLNHRPTPKMANRIPPSSARSLAYDFTLRGDYLMDRRVISNFRMAQQYFQKAIDADPNYAPAYVGMAKAYNLLSFYGGMPGTEALPASEANINRALEIDPNLALGHMQKGYVLILLHRDFVAAEHEFKKAMEINPNMWDAYAGYASALHYQGRFDEAIESSKKADELAMTPISSANLALIYFQARRYDDLFRFRQQRPSEKNRNLMYAQFYALAGRSQEALAELSKVQLQGVQYPIRGCIAAEVYALAGKKEEARKLFKETLERQASLGNAVDLSCTRYEEAAIYAALGERENMLNALDSAEKEFQTRIYWIPFDPVFDAYRSDPRFKEIVHRVTTPR